MEQLRGRTALVTGASGGLGAHLARRLAREGMNVALARGASRSSRRSRRSWRSSVCVPPRCRPTSPTSARSTR